MNEIQGGQAWLEKNLEVNKVLEYQDIKMFGGIIYGYVW